MCKENSAPLKSEKGAIMAKKTATIDEKIQKLTVIKDVIEYCERQIEYAKQEANRYYECATDQETGELRTSSWEYSSYEENTAKANAYEELISDLEHLV